VGTVDGWAGVCPTPIFSHVAKGHDPTEPQVALPTLTQKQFYFVSLFSKNTLCEIPAGMVKKGSYRVKKSVFVMKNTQQKSIKSKKIKSSGY